MTGKIISHFETTEHIGDHELGSVYAASHVETGQRVRLLLLPLSLEDDLRRQLLEDLKRLAAVDHPYLDLPLGYGETELGQLFVSYSLDDDAQSLEEQLRQVAALPPARACQLASHLASGLEALHQVGLCHGFLRPAFVSKAPDREMRILFSGLGRAGQSSAVLSRLDASVAYRAPEQIQGGGAGPQADLWTLGTIFYEMLTRRLPFQGVSIQHQIRAIVEQPLPATWEGIPADSLYSEILDCSLARDLNDRYSSAAAMKAALERARDQASANESKKSQSGGILESNTRSDAPRPAKGMGGSAHALVGKTFSHFEVLGRIGGGGMGEVFLARDLKLERKVALKFLSRRMDRSVEQVQRFIQEAKAASALDHPNICTIHEIEETEEGSMFIAMAFYDGDMLSSKIEQGPLDLQEIVEIGSQICAGLAAAHDRGIIHRDVKPANVVITRDGVVKILDFGLSKYNEGSDRSNPSGPLMGTVDYMAPEQALGKEVNQQTDIWSLGIVLFEMATGQRPFNGSNQLSVLFDIVHNEPRGVEETAVLGIPVELGWIIRKALTKDREKRYQNVLELKHDLEALREERPSTLARAEREQRRRRRILALVGGLLAAMMIVWVVFYTPEPEISAPPEPAYTVFIAREMEPDAVDELFSLAAEQILVYALDGEEEARIVEVPVGSDGRPDLAGFEDLDPESTVQVQVDVQSRPDNEWRFGVGFDGSELAFSENFTGVPPQFLEELLQTARQVVTDLGLESQIPSGRLEQPQSGGDTVILPQDAEVTSLLQEASAALKLQDAQKAVDHFDKALELGVDDPFVHLDRAEALRLLGRKAESGEATERAWQLSGELPLEQRLYVFARRVEAERLGDVSKARSAALFLALWQNGLGFPYNSTNAEERLKHILHIADALRQAGRNSYSELVLEILDGLESQFPDDPRIPLSKGEAAVEVVDRLEHLNRALKMASEHGADLLVARVQLRLGGALAHTRDFVAAEENLRSSMAIYEAKGNLYGKANAMTLLSNILWDQQPRLQEAKRAAQEAASLFERLGDNLMRARNLSNIALLLDEEGALESARISFKGALELSQEAGDRYVMALSLTNMANALIALGELEEAGRILQHATGIIKEDSEFYSVLLAMQGQYAMVGGRLEEARERLEHALERTIDKRQVSRAKILLAQVYHFKGEFEKAHQKFEESLQTYLETGTLTSYADRAHIDWGDLCLSQGKLDKAEEKYRKALEIQVSRGSAESSIIEGEATASLARVEYERGNLEKARELGEQGLVLLQSQKAVLEQSSAHELLSQVYYGLGQVDVAKKHIEKGRELLQGKTCPKYKIPLALSTLQVLAAEDRETASQQANALYSELSESPSFVEWEWEARLLIEQIASNCSRLERLGQAAAREGFGLIGLKAERLLSSCR